MKPGNRLLQILPCILILCSCQQSEKKQHLEPVINPPPHTHLREITLMDSLGKMSIYLPDEFDTSFFWTDYSDCGPPCDEIKYRFQPQSLVVDLETGFFHDYVPCDSINRLTISHSRAIRYSHGSDSLQINVAHNYNLESIKEFQFGIDAVVSDTTEFIGDRVFSIYCIFVKLPIENGFRSIVKANCTIRGNPISFEFIKYPDRDKPKKLFYDYCTQILRTCRFEKSK